MNKKRVTLFLKNSGIVIIVPLVVYFFMEMACMLIADAHVISSWLEINNLIKTTCVMTFSAIALSLNMSAGRMDFSLGAQQMAACVVGGNIAFSLGLGPIGVLAMCILFGVAAGSVVGILFVVTKIPSMVLGIGMALIYECIAFAWSFNGFQLYGKSDMAILGSTQFELAALAAVIIIFYFVFSYIKFGYHYRAIQGSQVVAKSMGINVYVNCVVCYGIAGGLIAASGVFDTSYTGVLASTMGLASTATTFTAMLAVFVANYLSRFTNRAVALAVGALTVRILSYGLIILQLPNPAVVAINYICLLLFLVFQGYMARKKIKDARNLRRGEACRAGNTA